MKVKCEYCKGQGQLKVVIDDTSAEVQCPHCKGTCQIDQLEYKDFENWYVPEVMKTQQEIADRLGIPVEHVLMCSLMSVVTNLTNFFQRFYGMHKPPSYEEKKGSEIIDNVFRGHAQDGICLTCNKPIPHCQCQKGDS